MLPRDDDAFFNPTHASQVKRTKVVATIGPACDNEASLARLVCAGMNVARINFSHKSKPEEIAEVPCCGTHPCDASAAIQRPNQAGAVSPQVVRRIRAVSERLGQSVAIMGDLRGPRVRAGEVEGGSIVLREGEHIVLTTQPVMGTPAMVTISHDLFSDVKPGQKVWIARVAVARAGRVSPGHSR